MLKIMMASIGLFFTCGIVHASPNVGDFAKYETTVNLGSVTKGTDIITITAFDPAAKIFTLHEKKEGTIFGDGESDEQDSADDLLANYYTIAKCLANGGKLTDVSVPAGKFHACMVAIDNDSTDWVADGLSLTTHGIVKAISKVGSGYIEEVLVKQK